VRLAGASSLSGAQAQLCSKMTSAVVMKMRTQKGSDPVGRCVVSGTVSPAAELDSPAADWLGNWPRLAKELWVWLPKVRLPVWMTKA